MAHPVSPVHTYVVAKEGRTLCKADLDPCKKHLIFLWMKPVGNSIWKSGCSKHTEPYVTGTPLKSLGSQKSQTEGELSLKWASQLTPPPRDSNALKEESFYGLPLLLAQTHCLLQEAIWLPLPV